MELLAGQQVQAGLGLATALPDLDFETYSEAGLVYRQGTRKWVSLAGSGNGKKRGLPLVGMSVYAEHPSTEILCLSYNLKDGRGPQRWNPSMSYYPEDLFAHIAAGGLVEAFNSMFEYLIWLHVAHEKHEWPELPLVQLRDAAAKARAYSYPGKLEKVAEIVGVAQKDVAKGKRVIKRYSMPRNPTKNDPRLRIHPTEEPEGEELYEYCDQDIVAESSVSLACPDMSDDELEVWLLDQQINARGVHIDMPSVKALSNIVEDARDYYTREIQQLTAGFVGAPSEVQKILEWLHGRGVHLDNLDDDALESALAMDLPQDAKRVLEIRQATASAGVKKLQALTYQTSSDSRYKDAFRYYRAHTGRWSSEGLQLQNMKSGGPGMVKTKCCEYYLPEGLHSHCPVCAISDGFEEPVEWDGDVMDRTIELLTSCDFERANYYMGPKLMAAIAGCMRGMVSAPPGRKLMCSDYSAIEAVGLAVTAGEQWRIEVFQTHGMIYEMSASKITGVPFQEFLDYKERTGYHHPHRKPFGKVPELASGYQGWIGAWLQFGADKFMTEEEIKKNILKWRQESPMIVEMWGGQYREREPGSWEFDWDLHGLEGTAIMAVLEPGKWHTYRWARYGVFDDKLFCLLPSGRYITYHEPRLITTQDRRARKDAYQLTHMVNNTNPKKGRMGWIRVATYGGMLTENFVQAVCRDILAHGLKKVAAAGFEIVGHVHDEIIAEVDDWQAEVPEELWRFEDCMMDLPEWAKGWPVKAKGGWVKSRYRKD